MSTKVYGSIRADKRGRLLVRQGHASASLLFLSRSNPERGEFRLNAEEVRRLVPLLQEFLADQSPSPAGLAVTP